MTILADEIRWKTKNRANVIQGGDFRTYLWVNNNPDDWTVLLHGIEVFVKLLLACLVLPLLSILSEGLLLALIPETQKSSAHIEGTTVWQDRMCGSITSMHRRALNDHTRVPVFIKSALALVTQVLSKDGFQGAQTTDRFDVSHNTHHNDRRSLNDGHRLNFFSLWLLCGRQKEADPARKTARFKSVKHAAGKQRVIKR